MMHNHKLEELVVRWQELGSQGQTPSIDELCVDCPELRDALTKAIWKLERLKGLIGRVPGATTTMQLAATDAGNDRPTLEGPRFQILRPHRTGGLGEVLVAYDTKLEREVALKRIQDAHAGNADSCRRFLREAKITGRLEHPGIVPVYDLLGREDGPPCYAMRLIQGETLKEAVERYHQTAGQGERALSLRQLLNRFLTVCQTIAYAHSRGIIHRDLKPANIILGQYGETIVLDWGLAKPVVSGPLSVVSGQSTNASNQTSGVEATTDNEQRTTDQRRQRVRL
jgi:serine/threonine protein kinase